jgi:DNA polymerase III epsilon subunit-like protein
MLATVRMVAAHNLEFDAMMIKREMLALGARDKGLDRPRLRQICTMKQGMALNPDGRYQTLGALHLQMTGLEFRDKHDSLGDSRAVKRIMMAMIEEGHIEL